MSLWRRLLYGWLAITVTLGLAVHASATGRPVPGAALTAETPGMPDCDHCGDGGTACDPACTVSLATLVPVPPDGGWLRPARPAATRQAVLIGLDRLPVAGPPRPSARLCRGPGCRRRGPDRAPPRQASGAAQ